MRLTIIKITFSIFFVSLFFVNVLAQQEPTKEQLQQQQKQLQSEIDELKTLQNSIIKNKKQSLTELAIVQRKIAKREQLVNNISSELNHINDDINSKEVEQSRLKKELDTLKQKYAQSIVFAYKNSSNYEYLNFLFSAKSFNDAYKRLQYLKSYRAYRETQVQTILKTQNLLQQGIVDLNNSKIEKNKVLENQNKQLNVLEQDKNEKDQLVNDLKSREKDITEEIDKREQKQRELRNAIAAAIRREVEEANRREKERLAKLKAGAKTADNNTAGSSVSKNTNSNNKPAPATTGVKGVDDRRDYSVFESTPEGKEMSINFENNKRNLPWPVSGGYISHEFGVQSVPGTKIREKNDGIYIATPVGSNVKSVADGDVVRILDLTDGQAVVVRHGKYFTIYSNLSSVNVSLNTNVKAGTLLGKASVNLQGNGEILFEITNDKAEYLDPTNWLKPR